MSPQTACLKEADKAPAQAPTTASPSEQQTYPAAQPGARPALPVQTEAPHALHPTPTRTTEGIDPPPPQPGAAPIAPGASASLPPPPKAGEKFQQQGRSPAHMPTPPQVSYPPPSVGPYHVPSGSSTSTAPPPRYMVAPGPTPLFNGETSNLEHPPGYQQNTIASGPTPFPSHGDFDADDEEGVWDTAKKWAMAAGDSLAAAEHEVWKKINKG